MKSWFISSIASLLLCSVALGQLDSFPYEDWTSKDGEKITARLVNLDDKQVTLQMKKGGKRYTLKRDKLLKESNAKLAQHREAVKQDLRKSKIDAQSIYKAVMVGIGDRVQSALQQQRVSFKVSDVRLDTNRTSGYLVLDDILFLKVKAPQNQEFFEKEKALYYRPTRKDRRFDSRKNVNELSRLVATEGSAYEVHFEAKTSIDFGTVGITDGVIIER